MPIAKLFLGSLGLFISCGWLVGCGYRAAYGERSAEQLAVIGGQVLVPDAIAVQGALAGARAELQRAGALRGGSTCPCLMVDLLRVDELSTGVAALAGAPVARGMGVAVVARGRIVSSPEAAPDADTGDLRRTSYLDGDTDPRADSALHDAALRAAAERAGRAVAKAALGAPEPADESL